MIIRTVLDLRPNLPKYILQTLLLAASWHRFARQSAALEVLHIGDLHHDLKAKLDELGVVTIETDPNANDSFSKTSNTIQGATPTPGHQILLVDNDTVFTGPIDDLYALPEDCVYGSVSGNYRVTQEQWAHIKTLGLSPAPCEPQIPGVAMVHALAARRSNPAALDFGYPNGGVILFPADHDFQSVWESHQRMIADAFADHPLRAGSVVNSNMAALATTIGSYGAFNWLPPGYNVRHAEFALGHCPASEIRLIHMTGFGRRTKAGTLSRWIDDYWSVKMTKALKMLRRILAPDEFQHRSTQLDIIHDKIHETISSYELDDLADRLVKRNFLGRWSLWRS